MTVDDCGKDGKLVNAPSFVVDLLVLLVKVDLRCDDIVELDGNPKLVSVSSNAFVNDVALLFLLLLVIVSARGDLRGDTGNPKLAS